jgi:ATP-dependent Lon protease
MTKRPSRESAKDRKCSEDMSDDGKSPKKRSRYHLRKRKSVDGTVWADDDTLDPPPPIELSIEIEESDSEEEEDEDEEDEDYEEEEAEEYSDEEETEFINYLMKKYVKRDENPMFPQPKPVCEKKRDVIPIKLSKSEELYYAGRPRAEQRELIELMNRVSTLVMDEGEVPNKFKVLKLPISDYMKSTVIKKITSLSEMCDSGESYKLKSWVDAFLRIPFGKTVPLPVQILDGQAKCTEFMVNARKQMDEAIYGMVPAKTQIMQIIAQWVVNPDSLGNVVALQGPMGVGKTSFAKNAIAQVLKRPFEFFSLGGASDIANFVGHSYTYEGSMWGRIADSLMHCKTMNPVLYFDELDKVSGTPHGEEIISMLIHMTDRSQNSQFHDRYFSGVDFDLSQCLFVFSFNDIEKVHPILRDRMNVIHCGGYSDSDKKVILKDYIWDKLLDTLKFDHNDVLLKDDAIKYLIEEYSSNEKGVRTLIRTVESMITRLNMLRVTNHESMKDFKFYMDVKFPLHVNESVVKTLLNDTATKEPETWRSMYN